MQPYMFIGWTCSYYFMESLDFLGGRGAVEKTLCSCLENSVFFVCVCVCMSENIMDITKWIIKRS